MTKNILGIVLILFFLLPGSTWAQQASVNRESGSTVGYSIYPPITKIRVLKPSTVKFNITIKNESSRSKELRLKLLPVETVKNSSGRFQVAQSLNPRLEEIFQTLKILEAGSEVETVTLLPQERKDLNISFDIKSIHLNGDYYFTLIFSSQGSESKDASFSSLESGISGNVLLTVAIDSQPSSKLSILRFEAPFLFFRGPVDFTAEVNNLGPNFDTVKGSLEIRNMFGQKVGQLELYPQNVLSGSSRLLNNPPQNSEGLSINERNLYQNKLVWDETFLFGVYKATIKISNGSEDKHTLSLYFLGIPLLLLFILILALTISIGIYLRVKRKRSKIKPSSTSSKTH